MIRHYMLKICLLLMVSMPIMVNAQEAEVESKQEILTQETPTPDIVVDEETNKPKILNDAHSITIDNSENEHYVSDDIIYNTIYNDDDDVNNSKDDYANNPHDN